MQSLWMLFATFVFAFMSVCVKLASSYYSTSEILMYRGMIGTAFLAALITLRGGTLKTRLPWHHLRRCILGATSLWLWFFSIGALPLATAMTLNYMSPIWMAAIIFFAAWWRRHGRIDWHLIAAVVASFIGVAMLLQPSIQADQWLGASIGLCSGILSAFACLQVRDLGRLGEPEDRVVFYFSATGMVGGLLMTLLTPLVTHGTPSWHTHSAKGMALLLAIGLSAAVAQMAMTRAYQFGKTLVTANLQYTGIVFSSIWGMLIWHDMLGWLAWSGILVILGSGVATTFYPAGTASDSPAAAPLGNDPIAAEV